MLMSVPWPNASPPLYLLCLATLFCCCSATAASAPNEDPIGVMKKMTTEYNLLAGPAFDLLGHLRTISERSKHFLKLTGPAGTILAACIESFIPHDDPMMRALGHLHSFMDEKFGEQTRVIESAMSRIRATQGLAYYDIKVHLPLERLTEAFQEVTDPAWVRSVSVKREFLYVCSEWELRPKDVMRFINRVVNVNCQRTKDMRILELISDFKSLFSRLFERFSEHDYLDALYLTYLQVLEQFVVLSYEDANFALDSIKNLTEKAAPGTTDLFDLNDSLREIFEDVPVVDMCLLRNTYEAYSSRRHPLIRLAEIVSLHTVKLAVIGGMCANITNAGDKRKVDEELEEISQYAEDITGNVTQWVSDELENVWPYEIIRLVKGVIKEEILDPYAYNYTATLMEEIASASGPVGANDKITELGTLMQKIETEIGPMVSQDLFHSYVIARVSTVTARACVLPVGLSVSQFANYTGYSMVEVYTHYWFPTTHDERFKLLLFI